MSRFRTFDRNADRKDQQRINEQIRITPIRVIGADGAQLGILATEDALTQAKELGLDLVEVAPTERPPVCRIMDYGKYKYQQKKRLNKGHVHHSQNKEVRLRPKIGDHDLETKVTRARGFLEKKDKVVFSVIFRGRENAHTEEGFKLVTKVIEQLADCSKLEQAPSMMGRRIVVTLAPK